MRRILCLCLCLAILAAASPASSRDPSPGIIGSDDRVRIESEGAPWDAIGQINIAGYRSKGLCTGTLVAPDLVVTAAHCVMDAVTKAPFPLHSIHFLAGVRGEKNKGHSTAKCLHFPEGYEFIGPKQVTAGRPNEVSLRALFKDAAAIVLNEPLRVAPAKLADAAPASQGAVLVHAAYPADRRFALSAHRNCHLLRPVQIAPLWITDCDTHPASSGGPVFLEEGGGLKLAAIMIAAGGNSANIALRISEWPDLARNRQCP
jgi:V8-like Glu-specific endopeptidase